MDISLSDGIDGLDGIEGLDDFDLTGEESRFYDEQSEDLPSDLPAYDEAFERIGLKSHRFMKKIEVTLSKDGAKEDQFWGFIYAQAVKLQGKPQPPKLRINLVGKSGAGKSSTLRNLLGHPDAAKSTAGGKGCTHIPTTYECALPDQSKLTRGTIEFFSWLEIHKKLYKMLVELLYCLYEQYDFPINERRAMEERTEAFLEALVTLFGDRSEFATESAAMEYLRSVYAKNPDTAVATILKRLMSWTESLIADCIHEPFKAGLDANPQLISKGDSLQKLWEKLDRFAYSKNGRGLWPLVKNIRISIRGIRILEYATITDWPGSDDTNHLRAHASADRIFDCDELWIVTSVDRVASDPSVPAMLANYGNTISCTVICTHAATGLDRDLGKHFKDEGYDTSKYDLFTAREDDARAAIDKNSQRTTVLAKAITTGYITKNGKRQKLAPEDRSKFRNAIQQGDAKTKELKEDLQGIQQEQLENLLSIRDLHVKLSLRKLKEKQRRKGIRTRASLVSNEHYLAHKGYTHVHGPLLSPKDTGIPGLRVYILRKQASPVFDAMKARITIEAAGLIAGMSLVTTRRSMAVGSHARTLKLVLCKETTLYTFKEEYIKDVNEQARTSFVDPFKESLRELQAAAIKHLKQYRPWPWNTLRAFARRDGYHMTPAVGAHEWNPGFLEAAGDRMDPRWADFVEVETARFETFKRKAIEACRHDMSRKCELLVQYGVPRSQLDTFIDVQIGRVELELKATRKVIAQQLG